MSAAYHPRSDLCSRPADSDSVQPAPVTPRRFAGPAPEDSPVECWSQPCKSVSQKFLGLHLPSPDNAIASTNSGPAMPVPSQSQEFHVDDQLLSGILALPRAPATSMSSSTQVAMQSATQAWLQLLDSAAGYSILVDDSWGTPSSQLHQARIIQRFAPSTLEAYMRVWQRWSDYAAFHTGNPFDPTPLLLADFLSQQSLASPTGSALNAVKGLNWMCRHAGLQKLANVMSNPMVRAYQFASVATVRREALPLTLSFVLWLEDVILLDRFSVALRIMVGSFLLAIWASLRFSDLLWIHPESLHFSEGILRCMAHRTKVTKRGMAVGIISAGFRSELASSGWIGKWLHLLSQALADTKAKSPTFQVDFLIPHLAGPPDRPYFHAPLSRINGVKILRSLWATQLTDCGVAVSMAHLAGLGVHSLKVTLLSWARQLNLDESLRLHQGHHRMDGARHSVSLYSRDDVHPCLKLQGLIVQAVRGGFRPLQPVLRGSCPPLADLPVMIAPLDDHGGDNQPSIETIPEVASPSPVSSGSDSDASFGMGTDEAVVASHPTGSDHLGPADEYIWLLNRSTMVAHVARLCESADSQQIEHHEGSFKFACGTRLTITDRDVEVVHELPAGIRCCQRHGCRIASGNDKVNSIGVFA